MLQTSLVRKALHSSFRVRSSSLVCGSWPSPLRFSTSSSKHDSTAPKRSRQIPSALLITGVAGVLLGFGLANTPAFASSPTPRPKAKFGTPEDFEAAIRDLQSAFSTTPKQVSTDPDDLYTHGYSPNALHPGITHSVVIYPESTEDVVKIVKIATQYRMPITPYSGATSLEGQYRGVSKSKPSSSAKLIICDQHPGGGICVDMSNMDRVIAVHGKLLYYLLLPKVT